MKAASDLYHISFLNELTLNRSFLLLFPKKFRKLMSTRIILNYHAFQIWGAKEELLDIYHLSNFLNVALIVAFNSSIIKCINIIQLLITGIGISSSCLFLRSKQPYDIFS